MPSNEYYDHSNFPTSGALLSSSAMRAELDAITAGFDKLPVLTGNGGKIIAVNSGGTALEVLTTTGTGSAVRATSPTLVTPILGTPTSGTLTNCTGYAVANVSGTGAGVLTALAVAVGTDGAFVVKAGALGTPSSGTLTSCTGLPVSTGLTGAGTGVLTALGVNVGTDGAFVVKGGALGTPSSGTLTSCTGLPVSTGITGAGTGVITALGVNVGSAGAVVVNGGALGAPSSGTLTSCTGLPVSTGLTGAGTGVLTALAQNVSGSGSIALTTSPSFTTPTLGVATATSINKLTLTAPASSATLTVADGKTLTASNTLTFTGTDGSSVAFGTGGTVLYRDTYGPVASSDFTTTSTTLVDVTGMSVALAANSTYIVTAQVSFKSSSGAGGKFALQYSAAGGAVEAGMISQGATGTLVNSRISALASASAAVGLTADADMNAVIVGRVTTGANAGNLTVQGLKVTSGTLTVYIGSSLSVTKVA
jgi:hypothetical protein